MTNRVVIGTDETSQWWVMIPGQPRRNVRSRDRAVEIGGEAATTLGVPMIEKNAGLEYELTNYA